MPRLAHACRPSDMVRSREATNADCPKLSVVVVRSSLLVPGPLAGSGAADLRLSVEPVLRGRQSSASNQTAACAFARSGSARRIHGENMPSRILRRSRRSEQQTYRKTEPSREVQSIENKAHAAAIAAQLRAQIPCSTDPARLEKMAREVESRAAWR